VSEPRQELVDALALLLQLRDVGAMGQTFQAIIEPAIVVAKDKVRTAVDAWVSSWSKS